MKLILGKVKKCASCSNLTVERIYLDERGNSWVVVACDNCQWKVDDAIEKWRVNVLSKMRS